MSVMASTTKRMAKPTLKHTIMAEELICFLVVAVMYVPDELS
jgi:hypothetical protein